MTPAELLDRHADVWRSATGHPFLDAVRDGSLPHETFDAWLVQDRHFVLDELRFQARLLALAPRPDQALLAGGLVALEAELRWMEEHGAQRRLDLSAAADATALAYRAHFEQLLAAGYPPALTGLWTLERAYLDAWRRAAPGAGDYRQFVEHWTAPEFAAYVEQLAELVE